EGLLIATGLRTLPSSGLLRQHAFGIGLILLGATQGLGSGIELRIQRHQDAHVVVGVTGQLPHVLLFEVRELGILLVNGALGVFELAAEELGGVVGNLGASAQVFIQYQRGHGIADFLRARRVAVGVSDIEAGQRLLAGRTLLFLGAGSSRR